MDKETFKARALEHRKWYHKGQRNWSFAHHCALFGSIVCSITAGALLQFGQTTTTAYPKTPEPTTASQPTTPPASATSNRKDPTSSTTKPAEPTQNWRSSWAAVLTSIAAALTGIASSGGFERKWRSNRLSRSRVDALLLDVEADNPDLNSLQSQLKEIIQKHDLEIVTR